MGVEIIHLFENSLTTKCLWRFITLGGFLKNILEQKYIMLGTFMDWIRNLSKFVKNVHMANALDREMYRYFTQLNDAEKKSVVELLKTFMKGRKNQSNHITIEQYNKELDEAMDRVGQGEYTTFEDLEKEMKSW